MSKDRKVFMVYIQGDVLTPENPSCSTKVGPTVVLTFDDCLPDIRLLLANYEKTEGQCTGFHVHVIK